MQIVSRAEALAAGLKRFYTGESCAHGHICERITSNKACITCHRAQSAKHRASFPELAVLRNRFYKAEHKQEIKQRHKERRLANPGKHNRLSLEWRLANPDRWAEIRKRHYEKNRVRILAVAKQQRLTDPERQRSATQRWRERHPEKAKESARRASAKAFATKREYMIAYIRKRKVRTAQATPPWADMKAIAKKFKEARNVSLNTGIAHVVDHIYPLQGKLSCGLNIALNMQIITAVENRQKSNKMPLGEGVPDR